MFGSNFWLWLTSHDIDWWVAVATIAYIGPQAYYLIKNDECRARPEQRLIEHADSVLKCAPRLKDHTYQLPAAVSFAYNVGAGAYWGSTTAKHFNAGDWKGACRALNEADNGRPQWVTAGGRVLPGLVKRRAEERALCKRGL
ncbi:glycoside hydrolase family protein [Burkholderia multivorans]|uniref:glycoside hydrolase family protein n=1 Tax=Burkholderia multivorans TaxID=87883 RepID=UPI001C261C60|nr:glycoside hydrolase family protein [Burkholderia multivorans]MCA8413420.1 glycoside hydrolase family protein [Burkholderia multivorans]MDN7949505.1 glycoside hydrolase family protein [Burkholderia multivorans]MDN7961911.1 glycoside hydrolase family protein [Burkholderia multivorans]